jgi:hypothetical protein
MKPHIHAELIKAWADGAEIESRHLKASGWTEWKKEEGNFIWQDAGAQYRIKSEPMPDIVVLTNIGFSEGYVDCSSLLKKNIKLVFDGEGELKSAEVIK